MQNPLRLLQLRAVRHWRNGPSGANSQSYQQRLVQNAQQAPSHLI